MIKNIEKLKKELQGIAEVVNSFKSEAVQLRVIDKLLEQLPSEESSVQPQSAKRTATTGKKPPGATRMLNRILATNFFDKPRTISVIADRCKEEAGGNKDFKTSELSGILLKLIKEEKLKREDGNSGRYEYVKNKKTGK